MIFRAKRKQREYCVLQEILGCLGRLHRHGFAPTRRRIKLQELIIHLLVHFQNGRLIATPVTVIGSRKNRHDRTFVTPVVPFHDELMRPSDGRKTVAMVKGGGNIRAKGKSGSPRRNAPPGSIVRITPQEIAHGSFVRHFLHAIQLSHVIQSVNARTETAVQTKNGIFHHGREGKVIKQIGKELPHVGRSVFAHAFVVKSVDLGNLTTLVIAAEHEYAIGVADLETDQERDGFDTVIASIDVIAHEQVIGIRSRSTDAKEFHEIVPLSVNVAADGNGGGDGLDVGFLQEPFAGQFR
jgi:hypothetical protein